jgi:hypothetical protein
MLCAGQSLSAFVFRIRWIQQGMRDRVPIQVHTGDLREPILARKPGAACPGLNGGGRIRRLKKRAQTGPGADQTSLS